MLRYHAGKQTALAMIAGDADNRHDLAEHKRNLYVMAKATFTLIPLTAT